MMIFNFFYQLSNATGLPLIVLIFAVVLIFSLCLFGIFILIRVRSIKKVLNNVNIQLDTISHRLGLQSAELENIKPHKFYLGSQIKNEIPIDGHVSLQSKSLSDTAPKKTNPEKHQINTEISTRIHELLKKTGKPTPYHDLTKHLSQDYPGYDYEFFLKEAEALQKEGKVEVQLIAGKLYFQLKNT